MRICFMRHGECEKQDSEGYHLNDTPLTKLGIKQCKNMVPYLKKLNIKAIYSSPKKRAVQSATVVGKVLGLDVKILPEIDERFKISMPKNPAEKLAYDNYLNYNYKDKNLPTCKDFIDSTSKGLRKIIKTHKRGSENVLLVGHSANLYAISAFFNGIPADGKIIWQQCSNASVIQFEVL